MFICFCYPDNIKPARHKFVKTLRNNIVCSIVTGAIYALFKARTIQGHPGTFTVCRAMIPNHYRVHVWHVVVIFVHVFSVTYKTHATYAR